MVGLKKSPLFLILKSIIFMCSNGTAYMSTSFASPLEMLNFVIVVAAVYHGKCLYIAAAQFVFKVADFVI